MKRIFDVTPVGYPLTRNCANRARGVMPLLFSMFNGEDVGMKALTMIPCIIGPASGAFAAYSTYKPLFGKKEAKPE